MSSVDASVSWNFILLQEHLAHNSQMNMDHWSNPSRQNHGDTFRSFHPYLPHARVVESFISILFPETPGAGHLFGSHRTISIDFLSSIIFCIIRSFHSSGHKIIQFCTIILLHSNLWKHKSFQNLLQTSKGGLREY